MITGWYVLQYLGQLSTKMAGRCECMTALDRRSQKYQIDMSCLDSLHAISPRNNVAQRRCGHLLFRDFKIEISGCRRP